MRKNLFIFLAVCMAVISCKTQEQISDNTPKGVPFQAIDTSFTTQVPLFPAGMKYQLLFRAGDQVVLAHKGIKAPAKEKHDFMAYIPVNGSSEEGWLWVNHETTESDDLLGDGGGGTFLHVKKENGEWKVIGDKVAADFSPVGGTWTNCLGGVTPWGNVLTSEEYEPFSNGEILAQGVRDTTDFNGYKKYLNYGWVVEIDPNTQTVLRKLWTLGRFSHEGIYCMPDGKTVYLMDDYSPGVFFRFIASKKNDYTAGQLAAYKQSADGNSGEWINLPMERDSLNDARNVALRRGATIFIRLEDIELANDGTFYLTETGRDKVDLSAAVKMGGVMALHQAKNHTGNQVYKDICGRILRFNPADNSIKVFLEGGPAGEGSNVHLGNPDNLSYDKKRNLLVIHEDVNKPDDGRVPAYSTGRLQNEIYFLDLSKPGPGLKDLVRFSAVPSGSESTGPCWTPDFNSYFFNIQHPLANNKPPFDRSCTVVVTGFGPGK